MTNSPLSFREALTNNQSPPAESVFLRRVSYGIAPAGHYAANDIGDLAKFNQSGSDLKSKVSTWVSDQLDVPKDLVKTDIAAHIDPSYRSLGLSVEEEWERFIRHRPPYEDEHVRRPIEEHQFLYTQRAIYSEYQLFERLSLFWHDHFNIYGLDGIPRSLWGTWDQVIRTGLMGNFYEMLRATAEHPAMLYYLDNYENTRAGPNENYAREIFELHTLGATNYFGVTEQSAVPTYQSTDGVPDKWIGKPKGYVDEDVYEATRLLTGWHFDFGNPDIDTGKFIYHDNDADYYQKFILGHLYGSNGKGNYEKFGAANENSKLLQGRHMLYQLATHPGTAQHIAWKLVKHFLSDNPPEPVVAAVAKTFMDNADAPDQLKKCYVTLFNHAEMTNPDTWGEQKARPFEVFAHACRTMGCQRDFRPFGENEAADAPLRYQALQSYGLLISGSHLPATGHRLFYWQPPDGYPHDAKHWMSSSSIMSTWRLVNFIAGFNDANFLDDSEDQDLPVLTILPTTLAQFPNRTDQTPANIVKFWATRIWGFEPSDVDIEPFITFFCTPATSQTSPPWDKDYPISDGKLNGKTINSNNSPHWWYRKLRTMVSALFTHPYAMLR